MPHGGKHTLVLHPDRIVSLGELAAAPNSHNVEIAGNLLNSGTLTEFSIVACGAEFGQRPSNSSLEFGHATQRADIRV